jgi:hypothetical protein
MITFIKNEFIKVKSEKFIIIVILLSLIPFVMNLANFLINNQNLSLVGGFYFRFYNQYFMIMPIVMGIIGSSIFFIEYKNHTLLNWLTYSKSTHKLFLAKFIASFSYCFFLYALNLLLVLGFYLLLGRSFKELELIFFSFTLLNIFLALFMLPLSISIVVLFNNYIASIVTTIGISMISMILIPAPFANLIPSTLGYRLGITSIDSSLGFDSPSSLIIGILISLIISIILILAGSKNLKIH